MTYKVGDVVIVSNPSTFYTDQYRGERAAVTAYVEGEIFPYELTFTNGHTLGFAEEELSPVPSLTEFLEAVTAESGDEINHPSHYTWLPNGVEVIDITELLNFNLGNVVKYVLRANHKHDEPLTDLRKAAFYIQREIERLEKSA
ncbi:DUF3310 domain-containing protein [Streptomyces werraensis]|uniref:DUF3310 domain-containing protein n=1 Tax=Streptomyces werraensis TaxID=68284 RepID=UPI0037024B76